MTGFNAHFDADGKCIGVHHEDADVPEPQLSVPISNEDKDRLRGVPFYRWCVVDGRLEEMPSVVTAKSALPSQAINWWPLISHLAAALIGAGLGYFIGG